MNTWRLRDLSYVLLFQRAGVDNERCVSSTGYWKRIGFSWAITRGGYFTALRLKASLAGRSRHETQGSAKVVGVRIPNPAADTHLSTS